MSELRVIGYEELLMQSDWKHGYIKCRLIHLDGRSVIQPDILFGDRMRGHFFIPHFFDPNQIAFFEGGEEDFCRLTVVVRNAVCLRVGFFKRDHLVTFADGSVIYKCVFSKIDGDGDPPVDGRWRQRGDQRFQLKLFHHTNETGHQGITESCEIWGSRRNIQGNLWLNNIAYGYFTNLPAIRTEVDLLEIAMSSSGLTGLIPTNAPYHPRYATMVHIPQQMAADRSLSMSFWIDADLIAPNHLWIHRPMDQPAYYEAVLPRVFRVGVKPDATLLIDGQEIRVPEQDQKLFEYVIVGNADTHEGLEAPYHEEETTDVAAIERFAADDEIIGFWQRNANTNQFDGRIIEHAELDAEETKKAKSRGAKKKAPSPAAKKKSAKTRTAAKKRKNKRRGAASAATGTKKDKRKVAKSPKLAKKKKKAAKPRKRKTA